MLVLERKAQEGFWIDGRIYVKVIAIGKRRVKLGIEAPPDLNITRSELRPEAAIVPHENGTQAAMNEAGASSVQVLPGRRRN